MHNLSIPCTYLRRIYQSHIDIAESSLVTKNLNRIIIKSLDLETVLLIIKDDLLFLHVFRCCLAGLMRMYASHFLFS